MYTLTDHEDRCAQARKTGLEIMENLEKSSTEEETKLALYKSIFALFSYGRTSIHGIDFNKLQFDKHTVLFKFTIKFMVVLFKQ